MTKAPAILLVAAIAMGGCQSRGREVHPPQGREKAAECPSPGLDGDAHLLSYYGQLKALDTRGLQVEIDAARKAFEHNPSDRNRVALALALSVQVSGNHDEYILGLLKPIAMPQKREQSALRSLAMLLHSEISERLRLADALQQRTARIADMQRKLETTQQNADSAQARTEVLQERVDGLQQKLDALLEMEMEMLERENVPLPKRKQP